ncbi:MAG: GDSL-type esterase/lipase family protein [Muribaculaceae bacterium]
MTAIKNLIAGALAVCSITMVSAADKYQYNEFYYQRSSLFEVLPISCNDIVFVGNSLTNGCEWHELFNNPNVKNRGISSDVIQGVADRIDNVIKGKPQKIFLMSGANDISHNISADSIACAFEKLIVRIINGSPSTEIYLQGMLPINNDFGRYKALKGTEQVFIDTNKQLEKIAKKHHVTWINLFPLFADKDGKMKREYSNDGLHLLGAGYLVWRDAIINYVNE